LNIRSNFILVLITQHHGRNWRQVTQIAALIPLEHRVVLRKFCLMKTYFSAAVALLLLPAPFIARVAAQDSPSRESLYPSINISGRAEVSRPPDLAVVRIGAVAQARDARLAQNQVNNTVGRILEALRSLEIPDRDLKTTRLSLTPVYAPARPEPRGRFEPAEPRIAGYRASNTVEARTQDVRLLGDIIDLAVASGANHIENISFELKDDRAARQEALRRAVAEARGKAEAVSEAMNVSLGSILEVVEGGVEVIRPPMEFTRMAYAAPEAGAPVEPGEIRVEATVTIRFRIEQN
jgi:uncharacterized protein